MDPQSPQNQDALRAELREARERLEALVADLRAADAELESLASERESHRLLEQACVALDELRERGAAGLFWGDADGEGHLREVRRRVEAFEKRLHEVEERRQEVFEAIEAMTADLDLPGRVTPDGRVVTDCDPDSLLEGGMARD